ncbi:MAG: AAA family ATPase [Candidatus Methanomethylophilaceae archaeon]
MRRKIDNHLAKWRSDKDGKCLMIEGARQVGKTYSVSEFGKNYDSYIEINFANNPELSRIFDNGLDAESILFNLRIEFPGRVTPNNTLLLLDETHLCSPARTALKPLAVDGRLDVISSGSLLGLHYEDTTFILPGTSPIMN